ncbi:LIM domain-containing protein [Changchengzhania lutea]|uniref:hypothetical protein n=1 Tax=Changchengzhania lutea TaxID=2049305 RepID=UPI00115F57EB|nr:hypothetical protein [Changchengzhania lutea]
MIGNRKPVKVTCKICSKTLIGRKDKLFCSVKCKNYYHVNLRKATDIVVKELDNILHRNRSILLEIMGKRKVQCTVERMVLEKNHFVFKYHTHLHTNSKGKIYHYVYDFAWMEFSNDDILIVRKTKHI